MFNKNALMRVWSGNPLNFLNGKIFSSKCKYAFDKAANQWQEQSLGGALLKRCSYKFRKNYRKTPATSLKKRPWHTCFPVNFETFLRTNFLTEHLPWLLLQR